MYAVIFKAQINTLDDEYFQTAKRMRELAIDQYGCLEFVSTCEGGLELAISYWPDQESIRAWHRDSEHRQAQELGKTKWYRGYSIQVTEVLREYAMGL